VTFLFCDLKDFTAYAQVNGDAAAIAAIERFFTVIAREHGEHGELVKSLGDGAMLAYEDPAEAVAAGVRVIEEMRAPGLPGVHASVHRGVAIARSGDYFGHSVNLAARLLSMAGRDELVATDEAVQACRDDFAWEPAGAHAVRGVPGPVTVYRLVVRAPAGPGS
jgi:adenylate cyclase